MKPTHRHADGGLYTFVETGSLKDPQTDEWHRAVFYRGQDGRLCSTTKERWEKRFVALEFEPVDSVTLRLDNDEGDTVAEFCFTVEQADDVRYMLITANPQANSRITEEARNWMKTLLSTQADAISKGLHIRDHDFPDLIGDVNAFHAKFGQEYVGKPRALPQDLHDFRVKFHEEECIEYDEEFPKLLDAIERKDRRDILNSLELQLDALVDATWVILGTADLQFGRHKFIEAWRRVVKANMAKVRKDATEDGDGHEDSGRAPKYDIVKPAGWVAPDHRELVLDNAVFDEIFGTPAEVEKEA
jgi:predicted HAD superfamily Cof-like phosphohydrolase